MCQAILPTVTAGLQARPRHRGRHVDGTLAARALAPVALTTLAATYALALLGSTVRVTESGMGCPSWPLCDGRIGPVDQFHALLEQSHRYLAAAATVGVVALLVLAWRAGARRPRRWAALSTGTVGVQVVLGAVTVFTHNAPPTVALHLLVGLLLLAAVTVTAVASVEHAGRDRANSAAAGTVTGQGTTPGVPGQNAIDAARPRRRRPDLLAGSALAATFVLLVSGSLVVDGGAARACPSWPWCTPHGRVGWHLVALQLAHRGMAAVAGVLLVGLALRTLARRARPRRGTALAAALLALLVAQIAAGAASALLRAPAAAQDVHLGLGAATWAVAVALAAAGTTRPLLDVAPPPTAAGERPVAAGERPVAAGAGPAATGSAS